MQGGATGVSHRHKTCSPPLTSHPKSTTHTLASLTSPAALPCSDAHATCPSSPIAPPHRRVASHLAYRLPSYSASRHTRPTPATATLAAP